MNKPTRELASFERTHLSDGAIEALNAFANKSRQLELNLTEEPPKQVRSQEAIAAEAKRRTTGVPTGRRSASKLPLAMRTLEGAILVLRNLGYNFIIEHGEDPTKLYKSGWEAIQFINTEFKVSRTPPKAGLKRRPSKYPRFYVRSHIQPFIQNMAIGDCVELPSKHADGTQLSLYSIQSSACSVGGLLWGKGSVTTSMNPKNKTVEVLRLA